MNLKNYTSSAPIGSSIARIESLLAEAGANGISKDYSDGKITALRFQIRIAGQMAITIRLPINHDAVFASLRKKIKRPRDGTLDRLEEQAMRTSWRLMQDWVEIQLSLIQLHKIDLMEVFLPYVWDGERTFYQAVKDGKFLALRDVKQ